LTSGSSEDNMADASIYGHSSWEGVRVRVVFLSMGLAAVMSFMTGCSSSKCESVCAEANACGLTERRTNVDCPEFCQDVEDFNARAAAREGGQSCQAQFDAHLECWETNSAQICKPVIVKDAQNRDVPTYPICEESGAAWTECMAAHCAAVSESEDGATDPNCFDTDPALYPF